MKKYILFLIFVPFLIINGCDDNEEVMGGIDPVSNVECIPFIGSVTLNWTNPENSDYYYTLITYMNSEGEKVNKKVSKYSVDDSNKVSVIVGGFTDVNEHEFILTSFGYSGSSSSPVIIKGSPLGIEAAKDYVVNTVTAEPADEGAKLSWTNETSVGVNLIVSYVDKNEKKQIFSKGSSWLMLETLKELKTLEKEANELEVKLSKINLKDLETKRKALDTRNQEIINIKSKINASNELLSKNILEFKSKNDEAIGISSEYWNLIVNKLNLNTKNVFSETLFKDENGKENKLKEKRDVNIFNIYNKNLIYKNNG